MSHEMRQDIEAATGGAPYYYQKDWECTDPEGFASAEDILINATAFALGWIKYVLWGLWIFTQRLHLMK